MIGELPKNSEGKHIASFCAQEPLQRQITAKRERRRAGLIPFINCKVALKELNETAVWLRILRGSFGVQTDFVARLVAENTELCKILVASIQTARKNNVKAHET